MFPSLLRILHRCHRLIIRLTSMRLGVVIIRNRLLVIIIIIVESLFYIPPQDQNFAFFTD